MTAHHSPSTPTSLPRRSRCDAWTRRLQSRPPPPAVARLTRRLGLAALYAAAGVVACAAGFVASDRLSPQPVPRPTVDGLSVDPDALDLGELWEHPRHVVRLTVRNDARTPRVVEKWSGSCDCTTIAPAPLTLPPGGSAEVTVTIDLTKRSSYFRGVGVRPLAVQVQPVFAGHAAPAGGWTLTGTVRGLISPDVGRLDLLDGCVHGGPPRSRTFHVTAHHPLARVEAEADPYFAAVRVEPDGPGRYAVAVTPDPRLPAGPFHFPVRLRAVTPDGATHPAGAVAVGGEMHPPARVDPRTALVGEVVVPGPAAAEVAVRLPDGWAVERVESDAAGTDVKLIGPAPDGGWLYRITQPVPTAGDFRCEVRFVAKGPDGRTATAPVEVCGLGRPPGKEGRP